MRKVDRTVIDTEVLVVGAGGAGMYAAIAAARAGARVLLADKSMVGRGGATIMAQMTVAAALGEQGPDDWTRHLADTLEAGRGLVDERLAALLCEGAGERIRELDAWKVGWARDADGRLCQVTAPGHGVPHCVYVDFLNTGPAVAQCLRRKSARTSGITKASGLAVTDLVTNDGVVAGAVGFNLEDGAAVAVAARAVVIATGGLTRLYRRNSASANMTGEGYALALRAGAELIDMEFPSSSRLGISPLVSSGWTRSCGTRFGTSSAGVSSTPRARTRGATSPPGTSFRTRSRRRRRQGGRPRAGAFS